MGHDACMTDIGIPGSPDGAPAEPKVLGELVVTFTDAKPPSIKWPRIAGRSHREVVGEAVTALEGLLDSDVLDKVDGETPREPPR